jgi:hypothetical protein
MARKFKEKNKFFLSLAVQVSACAWHSHLSVVQFVKDQCCGAGPAAKKTDYTYNQKCRQAPPYQSLNKVQHHAQSSHDDALPVCRQRD